MNPFSFGGTSFGGFQSRELAQLYQRKKLEDEISAIKDRQRRAQRHQRRQIIVKQVQQLAEVLKQAQNDKVSGSRVACAPPRSPTPTARDERSSSVEWMLIKLMQQNEELQAIIKHQRTDKSGRIDNNDATPTNDALSLKPRAKTPPLSSDVEIIESEFGRETRSTNEAREKVAPQTTKTTSPIRGWNPSEDLPEVEWTDEDEQMLERLLRGEVDRGDGNSSLPGAADSDTGDSDVASILNRKQQQQDRHESRRKLTQLYDTSAISSSTGIRRPRWRIEEDTANGVVRPFDEVGEGVISEQPMPVLHVFRSAVIAVMAVLELQHLLYDKKLRLRDKTIQDFEPMLSLYFDATRVWLGKLVKTPLLSIIHEPTLDIDVSTKAGLFRAPKGISKWFQGPRSMASVAAPQSSGGEHSRAVKLKVRVKGIIDAIVKAIDKGDVPTGIQDFWKRLTSDSVYFPAAYSLFEMERQALDLDELGATRNTQDNYTAPSGQSYPRFQIILANFLLLRILVPHVVTRPWQIGLGSSSLPKAVMANLKCVATLLHAIIARISPLPAVGLDGGLSIRGGIRRRSVDVVPVTEPVDAVPNSPDTRVNNQDEVNGEEKRFLSISEIHSILIPEKQFPLDQFELFIIEQQQRLQEVLRGLHARIHPVPSEVVEPSATG